MSDAVIRELWQNKRKSGNSNTVERRNLEPIISAPGDAVKLLLNILRIRVLTILVFLPVSIVSLRRSWAPYGYDGRIALHPYPHPYPHSSLQPRETASVKTLLASCPGESSFHCINLS
jgi:hypothetical protein